MDGAIVLSFLSGIGFTVFGGLALAKWFYRKYKPEPNELYDHLPDSWRDE